MYLKDDALKEIIKKNPSAVKSAMKIKIGKYLVSIDSSLYKSIDKNFRGKIKDEFYQKIEKLVKKGYVTKWGEDGLKAYKGSSTYNVEIKFMGKFKSFRILGYHNKSTNTISLLELKKK